MDLPDAIASSGDESPETSSGPGLVFAEEAGALRTRERDGAPMGDGVCHNCQTELVGSFCHQCGQKHQDLDIRFSQLAADWLGGVIGFDARIWKTLRVLFLQPGQLTVDFFEGRRARFVAPLRLYLVASLCMLLSLAWSGQTVINTDAGQSGIVTIRGSGETGDPQPETPESTAQAPAAGDAESQPPGSELVGAEQQRADAERSESVQAAAQPEPTVEPGAGSPGAAGAGEGGEEGDEHGEAWQAIGETLENLGEGDDKDRRAFDKSFRDYLPQALFALVPVFALQLWVIFRRRYKRYLFHLIFSLHSHAAVFFLITVTTPIDAWLGLGGVLGDVVGLAFFPYFFIALRRVYGDRRLLVGLKLIVLVIVHSLMLALALLAAVLLAAWRLQGG